MPKKKYLKMEIKLLKQENEKLKKIFDDLSLEFEDLGELHDKTIREVYPDHCSEDQY